MFKVLTIGILLFMLYKVIMPAKQIDSPAANNRSADTVDVDYEEIK